MEMNYYRCRYGTIYGEEHVACRAQQAITVFVVCLQLAAGMLRGRRPATPAWLDIDGQHETPPPFYHLFEMKFIDDGC